MRRTDDELIRLHASLRKQAFEAVHASVTEAVHALAPTEKNASMRISLMFHLRTEGGHE